jgi:hypothetical protein
VIDYGCRAWKGTVEEGDMKGYTLEVRQQRFPWSLYMMAFNAPCNDGEPVVGFAVGRLKLAEHLQQLGVVVTWTDGIGPLAPERDRPGHRLPLGRRRRRSKRRVHPTGSGAGFSTRCST